jgi:hypothetical protein
MDVSAEDHDIEVSVDGRRERWKLATARDGRAWRLTLLAPHRTWIAQGPDLFEALRVLRRELDPQAIRLGCNGARRNAWASGMQRDMGEGRGVYLCELGAPGRPPHWDTLGPAPLEEVGTVAEQDAFHARWLADRGIAEP